MWIGEACGGRFLAVVRSGQAGRASVASGFQLCLSTLDLRSKFPVVGQEFGKFYVMYSVFNDQCVGILMGDQSVAVCSTKAVTVTP